MTPDENVWTERDKTPFPEWVTGFRPHQTQAVEEIIDHFDSGTKVVFLDAPTGAGKTTMMETLAAGLSVVDVKHVIMKMNPKAITAAQMFGKMDAATGDWTDGVFAVLWRKGTKAKNQNTWIA